MEQKTLYWQNEQVADYERRQRLLNPKKDEMLCTVVDFLPFAPEQRLHIVDMGAGQGALAEKVLQVFPNCFVTLLDSSEQMLSVARERLASYGSRISTTVTDFNSPDWNRSLISPVDAVIAASTLHYLREETRLPFFEKVFQMLSDDGCFINGGIYLSSDPFIEQRCTQRTLEHTKNMLMATEGSDVPLKQLAEMRQYENAKAGVNPFTIADQFEMLKASGFSTMEVVWRYLLHCVVVAYKKEMQDN